MQQLPLSGSILPFPPADPPPVDPVDDLGPETHEVPVFRRNVQAIVPVWCRCPQDQVRAWQRGGYFYCEYPDGKLEGFLLVKGTSWWNVLRQIQADLIRTDRLHGSRTSQE